MTASNPLPQPPAGGLASTSATLAGLRKTYARAVLDESGAASDPFAQFGRWMDEALAAGIPEPSAMTLATVGHDLRPSTRIVLLKGCDARGLVWFTNYQSRKGRELAGNPYAALQFHWVELERVVRIEGLVEPTSDAESDAYFQQRPLGSRIGAWASPQSEPVENRQLLEAAAERLAAALGATPARPPHWGGYRLVPDRWEFWQGRPNRLHDRLRYGREGDGWRRDRLAP